MDSRHRSEERIKILFLFRSCRDQLIACVCSERQAIPTTIVLSPIARFAFAPPLSSRFVHRPTNTQKKNAPQQQQMLQYRKAITSFQATAAERANTQLESSLQMELLNRISRSQRGLASTRNDRSAILDLIQRLEDVQATPTSANQSPTVDAGGGDPRLAAAAEAAAVASAKAADAVAAEEALRAAEQESVEGEWHLEYVSNEEDGVQEGWDLAGSTDPQKEQRVGSAAARSRSAFDFRVLSVSAFLCLFLQSSRVPSCMVLS